MILDGRKIAEEMGRELALQAGEFLRERGRKPRLDIVYVGHNPVIENFIRMKKKFGESIGVETLVHTFPEDIDGEDLKKEIQKISGEENSDGVIIQLPLPKNLERYAQEILESVPEEKDVDVLSQKAFRAFATGASRMMPPVAGAVGEILERGKVEISGKKNKKNFAKILVLGEGKLVGKPVSAWLLREGADVVIANSTTPAQNLLELLANADIIISGIGSSGFIKPEMIREGVVLIDAGTTEQAGKVAGDADPTCAEKCTIFTPVPGGVGPMTIAVLFQNMLNAETKN